METPEMVCDRCGCPNFKQDGIHLICKLCGKVYREDEDEMSEL